MKRKEGEERGGKRREGGREGWELLTLSIWSRDVAFFREHN